MNSPASRRRGSVLVLALILLVALSIGAVALVRSVTTSNLVAGNLAFQNAATHSADTGVEAAVAWLEGQMVANTGLALQTSDTAGATRYLATRQDPTSGQSWDDFWNTTIPANAKNTMATDASGNTVSYVIHRLCNTTGDPNTAGCSAAPNDDGETGNSAGAGVVPLRAIPQVYYRITVRVAGPRNTVSYVQAVVRI